MFAGYVLDIAQYIFLQFWIPSLDDTWVVFLLAVAYGLVDGVLQLSAQGQSIRDEMNSQGNAKIDLNEVV